MQTKPVWNQRCCWPPTRSFGRSEEIPTWLVFVGDDQGEPKGTVYRCFSYTRAQKLAQAMSNDRRLELIDEAQPATPFTSVPAQAAAA